MKLLSFIALPTLYAATIPSGSKFGINAALSNVLSLTQMEELEQHGCWCINMNILNSKFKSEGSTTIDELDTLCKQWFQQRACTKLTDGVCFENPTDDSYEDDNSCTLGSQCQISTCKLDEYFSSLILSTINALGFTTASDADQQECKLNSPGQNIIEDKVCGVADDVLFKVTKVTTTDHLLSLAGKISNKQSLWVVNSDPQITEPDSGNFNELLGARTPQGGDFGDSGNRGLGRAGKKRKNKNKRPAKPIPKPENKPEFIYVPFTDWRQLRDANDATFSLSTGQYGRWCGDLITQGRQQGGVRSDWAFSAASVAEDSICIASRGAAYDFLSTQQIANCCDDCKGDHINTMGYASRSLDYFIRDGLASGDDFMSDYRTDYKSCYPYAYGYPDFNGPLDPFELTARTGVCSLNCKHDNKVVADEQIFGGNAEVVWLTNRTEIKEHIVNHGPVIMWFQAYQDIFLYESGIYNITDHKDNNYAGNHYIKVIGWGTDQNSGLEYWECINSWKPTSGQSQTIKILMGMYSTEWYAWTGIEWTGCAVDELVGADGTCNDRVACDSTLSAPDNVILWNHYKQGELSPYVNAGTYCSVTHATKKQVLKFSNEYSEIMTVTERYPDGASSELQTINTGLFHARQGTSGRLYSTTSGSGVDKDVTSIFWIPTSLNKVHFWEVETKADGQISFQHHESCTRLINIEEVAEVNFNLLIADGFCDGDDSGIALAMKIINDRTDGHIVLQSIENGSTTFGNIDNQSPLVEMGTEKIYNVKSSSTFKIQKLAGGEQLSMVGFEPGHVNITLVFGDFGATSRNARFRN